MAWEAPVGGPREMLDQRLSYLGAESVQDPFRNYTLVTEKNDNGVVGETYFGKVFRCRSVDSQAACALKQINKELIVHSARDVERLAVECHVLRMLKHDNIAGLRRLLHDQNSVYLELNHMKGGVNLRQVLDCRSGRPLGDRDSGAVMQQLLTALQYIHSFHPEPVAHRDVSPENVMVRQGSPPTVLLAGFGSAKMYAGGQVNSTPVAGGYTSVYFAPPEALQQLVHHQAVGQWEEVTKQDIYAAGAVGYYCLTGVLPHRAGELMAMAQQTGHEYVVQAMLQALQSELAWPQGASRLHKDIRNAIAHLMDPSWTNRPSASQALSLEWFVRLRAGPRARGRCGPAEAAANAAEGEPQAALAPAPPVAGFLEAPGGLAFQIRRPPPPPVRRQQAGDPEAEKRKGRKTPPRKQPAESIADWPEGLGPPPGANSAWQSDRPLFEGVAAPITYYAFEPAAHPNALPQQPVSDYAPPQQVLHQHQPYPNSTPYRPSPQVTHAQPPLPHSPMLSPSAVYPAGGFSCPLPAGVDDLWEHGEEEEPEEEPLLFSRGGLLFSVTAGRSPDEEEPEECPEARVPPETSFVAIAPEVLAGHNEDFEAGWARVTRYQDTTASGEAATGPSGVAAGTG